MSYSKGFFDLAGNGASHFPGELGLKNVGFSVYVLQPGEGWDYFHSHREQEEVYLCIEGAAEVVVAGKDSKNPLVERVTLERGEVMKVEPETLRAIGNSSNARAVVIIAGGCPHPYPAGHGHDVIADIHKTVGHGETGFSRPSFLTHQPPNVEDDNC